MSQVSFETCRNQLALLQAALTHGQLEAAQTSLTRIQGTLSSLETACNRQRDLLLETLVQANAAADAAEQKKVDVFMKRKAGENSENLLLDELLTSKKKLASPKPSSVVKPPQPFYRISSGYAQTKPHTPGAPPTSRSAGIRDRSKSRERGKRVTAIK